MILDHFWLNSDPKVQATQVGSWLKTLKRFSASEINAGWERYQLLGPKKRNGALEKPMAVQLARIIDDMRRLEGMKPLQIAHEPPEREPRRGASPEQANAILEEFGYTPEHIARSKRFPRAASREELEELDGQDQERVPHWTESASPDRLAHLERVRNENQLIREARAAAAAAARRKANPEDDAA